MKLTETQQHLAMLLSYAVVDQPENFECVRKVRSFLLEQEMEHGSFQQAFSALTQESTIDESIEYVLSMLQGPTTWVYTESTPSPNKIEVVRYLRPARSNQVKNKLGFHSNMYGITVVYEIDYTTRMVQASFSICNGDNFSKAEGVQRAKEANQKVAFPLYTVDAFGDLTQAFLIAIGFGFGCEYNNSEFGALLKYLRKHNEQFKSK